MSTSRMATADRTGPGILALNAGSSSLKAALFDAGSPPRAVVRAEAKHLGSGRATMRIGDDESTSLETDDHRGALESILSELERRGFLARLVAVGHRIVHEGGLFDGPRRLGPGVVDALRELEPLDPDHLPAEIALVEAMTRRAPGTTQVLCFDTTFHRGLPRVARLVPLPRRYAEAGVRRYGFHGLSYEFLMGELARVAGRPAARGRVVLAHLGAGASLAAVREGRCVDTTMGFTPTSGVVMATRTGDLDPGVLLHLMRREGMDADGLSALVNRRSGLLGVSGSSGDMQQLLAREGADDGAADAVALFCHQVRKAIGALAAVLGGVDTLVFAGGIGEGSAVVRKRVTEGLEHLGIRVDDGRNEAGAPLVSPDGSRCAVRVIPTDEESVIARETLRAARTPVDAHHVHRREARR